MDKKILQKAADHLSSDPVMKKLIDTHQDIKWRQEVNLFQDVVESIISQQLSVKAADTITGRFLNLWPGKKFPSPRDILEVEDTKIREKGISYSKISYIKGLSKAVIGSEIDLDSLKDLPDEEVREKLTNLKGIGDWTAEMIMIFSLKRPDVFSMGDIGLRNAISNLYQVDRDDFTKIVKISKKWKPYRSIASRYLWKSLNNEPK